MNYVNKQPDGIHTHLTSVESIYMYSMYSGKERFICQHHKPVAQAVWKPEKYKETSHTTCCHYDNQAESLSLISCHSTQHRNPIAFKYYATRPMICSAKAFNTFANKIHRHTHGFSCDILHRLMLELTLFNTAVCAACSSVILIPIMHIE